MLRWQASSQEVRQMLRRWERLISVHNHIIEIFMLTNYLRCLFIASICYTIFKCRWELYTNIQTNICIYRGKRKHKVAVQKSNREYVTAEVWVKYTYIGKFRNQIIRKFNFFYFNHLCYKLSLYYTPNMTEWLYEKL